MRRALAPYALVAALVALSSSAAVVATARPSAPVPAESPAPTPVAAASHAAPRLSAASRLAFWRDDKLWVSDLDGSVRYSIASISDMRRVSLTRWSSDGAAVAFVDRGISLVVATVQERSVVVDLPLDLRTAGYRIEDLRWSPDGRRIATTVLQARSGSSDAYLVDLRSSAPAWTRLTTMDDLFIADWLSNEDVLAYTAGGAIVAVPASGAAVRLLAGVPGVSPIIAPDGRIDFLSGRVPFTRDLGFPYQTITRGAVWSMAADGSGERSESTWLASDVRLEGRLPDGRYLVHRGTSDALAVVTAGDVALLPSSAGVVERIRIAPDGRTAYGFTTDKIVRIDLASLTASGGSAESGAMGVFLDTGGEADVWFPPRVLPTPVGRKAPAAPSGRYAFSVGGHLWQLRGGVATLLLAGPPLRRFGPVAPKWAPDGRRLLVLEQTGRSYLASAAVIVGPAGKATVLPETEGAGTSYAWSPAGSELAVAVDHRGDGGFAGDRQLEVRFFDPHGRATRAPVPGREVAWTPLGLYLLAQGPSGQAIERLAGDGSALTLTTRDRIASDPRAAVAAGQTATLSGLEVSASGSLAAVRLDVQGGSPSRSFVVIVGPDGTPVRYVRADDLGDLAWSPKGEMLGYTSGVRAATGQAFVLAASGRAVATQAGRFAGWSPDGRWYLVARAGSLFAYPLDGGGAVLLGPGAAPISATAAP